MSSLIHCIYASAATTPFTPESLQRLLRTARERNQSLNVTGILLYIEGSFFQVLEGEAADVDALYARIGADERHGAVTLVVREPIEKRAFGDWSMGYAKMTPKDLNNIPGLNGFFSKRDFVLGIDAGRARMVLHAFASGRWRARIDGAGDARKLSA